MAAVGAAACAELTLGGRRQRRQEAAVTWLSPAAALNACIVLLAAWGRREAPAGPVPQVHTPERCRAVVCRGLGVPRSCGGLLEWAGMRRRAGLSLITRNNVGRARAFVFRPAARAHRLSDGSL